MCLALVVPTIAGAAPQCGSRERILAMLGARFEEARVAMGLANSGVMVEFLETMGLVRNGAMVELIRTANGSTWTIIITNPTGLTCIAMAGENWRPFEWRRPNGPDT